VESAFIGVIHLAGLYAILTLTDLDFGMHGQEAARSVWDNIGEPHLKMTVLPGSSMLRRAIRRNLVSFPSQIPVLLKQPPADMQWRTVLLYFVRGWSQTAIAERFAVPVHRISRTLNEWSIRALAFGHIQVIDPEECCRLGIECQSDPPSERTGAGAVATVVRIAPAVSPSVWARPEGAGLLASLDAAIAHCARWRGEFWVNATARLADLRTAAAVAVERGRNAEVRVQHEVRVRDEERVSHAVA